ncbi:MAG: hybrid sensor histidine kinase/response regulator, partial [Rikenellaceae bacterium]|nr:hybrid sensor histidine kinase/response regulator [Rikenellaceae bacterium]
LMAHPSADQTSSLYQAGYQIHQTDSEQELLSMAHRLTPQIIIIDIEQTHTTQKRLIEILKNDPNTFTTPLLIAFTLSTENQFPSYLNHNNIDVIKRPYTIQELLMRVRRQLLITQMERKIVKENHQLKRSIEAHNKFYSIVAHDLRAPIGTLKMINATLAPHIDQIKNQQITTLFKMIQETTEETFDLLENLLDWSQVQNGRTRMEAKTFNIQLAIHKTIALLQSSAKNKNIKIQEHFNQHAEVFADEEMIKSVLRNLIYNAIKFTYPGGHIDITTTDLPKHIVISIKDNGKGINPSDQKKLLKSCEHLTTYGTHSEKGSGLGLSLSQEFIKLNKGNFWFSSQKGVGTTFFFSLPYP